MRRRMVKSASLGYPAGEIVPRPSARRTCRTARDMVDHNEEEERIFQSSRDAQVERETQSTLPEASNPSQRIQEERVQAQQRPRPQVRSWRCQARSIH